jgi:hypothetical protein
LAFLLLLLLFAIAQPQRATVALLMLLLSSALLCRFEIWQRIPTHPCELPLAVRRDAFENDHLVGSRYILFGERLRHFLARNSLPYSLSGQIAAELSQELQFGSD